jgi:hypothetical protein
VTDLAAQVTAALERSVRPAVIARGAALRVVTVEDGAALLEMTGSPGAVWPPAARIEAHIRAAVPGIAAVQIFAPVPIPQRPAVGTWRNKPGASSTARSTRPSPLTGVTPRWRVRTADWCGSASKAAARAAAWRK